MEKSKKNKKEGLLTNIPDSYSSLVKANKIQKKVAKIGFDYKNNIEAINKVIEEAKELIIEVKKKNKNKIEEELGDLIFASLDVARILNLDPDKILYKSNKKFINRWEKIEKYTQKDKKQLHKLKLIDFNKYWKRAKSKS